MIPVGYKYIKVALARDLGDYLHASTKDVYSVCGCISRDFTHYIDYWKHNDYWLFDTPAPMEEIAASESLDLSSMTLFYYEVYEEEYNDNTHIWETIQFGKCAAMPPSVVFPREKRLEGFDVVSFTLHTSPEHSPLSCNGLDKKIPVNQHCLFDTFEEAKNALESGLFTNCEPGPYRIFAVYTVLQFK
jgi:hypothetical protein